MTKLDPRATGTAAQPATFLAQLSTPIRRFLDSEAGSAGLLLAAAVVALVWANSPWSASYHAVWEAEGVIGVGPWQLSMDLEHWVNDALMALFFFVVGLEVRREFSIGELTNPRRAVIPVLAAVGGLVLPAVLFLVLAPAGARSGWGVVIGTDTAFMLGALAVVGPRFSTQLRILMLTLTVIDDIIAVSVIGLFYSGPVQLPALAAMLACTAALWLMSRLRIWQATPYLIVVLALWLAALQAGLHASIAGMIGGLMIAARAPSRAHVEHAAKGFRAFRQSPQVEVGRLAGRRLVRAISVNERLQAGLHPWSSYVVVPVFALANAGVEVRDGALGAALTAPLTWAVVVGLLAGKYLGVGLTAAAGVRLGLGRLPQGVTSGHVFGGAAVSGIGFTVSLLIASLAFRDPELRAQVTIGILVAAVLAVLLGWVTFRLVARGGNPDADLPRVLAEPVDAGHDLISGNPDAPLTLVEYGDFECPFCSRTTGVVRELRERFGEDLRYVFRHLPLTHVHPHAELAARAAIAADAQGRFWDYHDVLFAHQDRLEWPDLLAYARDLGLDPERFAADVESPETAARLRADVASAEASGARGTPTFFVGARRHIGAHDSETLARALITVPMRTQR